jgi:trk system potassium uptake protein TrkA
VLRSAGIESADVFVAATSGDNRNIMAGQIARNIFHVPKVISRIKDPIRAEIYAQLGIEVDCRTIQGAQVILGMLGL